MVIDVFKVCLTSLFSYAALFACAKMLGHKQISQLDFWEYITGITIGSSAAEMATELEAPWKPLLAMLLYALISWALSRISLRYPRSRKYVNGTPTIVMDSGKLYRENLKKAKLDISEFMMLCRQQGYFDLGAIQTAVFEPTGKLSILPVESRRPATPQDLNLTPEQERLFVEAILDGRVLDGNLRRMGLDTNWLDKQLKAQGFESARQIFLAVVDQQHNLSCYPMESKVN